MHDHHKDKLRRYALAAEAAAGAGFMAYLTKLHFSGGGSALCDLSSGFSCQIVNQGLFSEIWRVPVAVLGLAYFVAVLVLLFHKGIVNRYRLITLFTIFSLVFSFYLTGIEIFLLGSICLFCEASKALMLLILALSLWGVRHRNEKLSLSWAAGALMAGLLFTGSAYWLQAG